MLIRESSTISSILVSFNARMSILLSLRSISISDLCFNNEGAFNEQIKSPLFLSKSLVLVCDDLSESKVLSVS